MNDGTILLNLLARQTSLLGSSMDSTNSSVSLKTACRYYSSNSGEIETVSFAKGIWMYMEFLKEVN